MEETAELSTYLRLPWESREEELIEFIIQR